MPSGPPHTAAARILVAHRELAAGDPHHSVGGGAGGSLLLGIVGAKLAAPSWVSTRGLPPPPMRATPNGTAASASQAMIGIRIMGLGAGARSGGGDRRSHSKDWRGEPSHGRNGAPGTPPRPRPARDLARPRTPTIGRRAVWLRARRQDYERVAQAVAERREQEEPRRRHRRREREGETAGGRRDARRGRHHQSQEYDRERGWHERVCQVLSVPQGKGRSLAHRSAWRSITSK